MGTLAYLALLEEALGIVDLDQPALADFHEAVGHGAGEIAVVADEQARYVALFQFRPRALPGPRCRDGWSARPAGTCWAVKASSCRKTSRARSPWLRMAIGSGSWRRGSPPRQAAGSPSRLGDAGHFQHVVEDRHVDRQVAHCLIEIDQPAGRVEAYRREAIVVLQLRIEGLRPAPTRASTCRRR